MGSRPHKSLTVERRLSFVVISRQMVNLRYLYPSRAFSFLWNCIGIGPFWPFVAELCESSVELTFEMQAATHTLTQLSQTHVVSVGDKPFINFSQDLQMMP